MTYAIKTLSSAEDEGESVTLTDCGWTDTPCPKTMARLFYREGMGFLLEMKSMEADAGAVHMAEDDKVHLDSCMELFINFDPENSDCYMNVEVNCRGNFICKIGPGRGDRRSLRAFPQLLPSVDFEQDSESWAVRVFIPIKTVSAFYGPREFKKGDVLKGNFYKCREEGAPAHFGAWCVPDTDSPDFHRPEFFGDMVIS